MPETTTLYRIENPTKSANSDGIASHEDLIGQWFTPSLETATNYLRKSTQTFGRDAQTIHGAQLVVAEVSTESLEQYHVSNHPIASEMDVEDNNYLIPRDGSIEIEEIPLDEIIGDLKGSLGNFLKLTEAKQRIIASIAAQSLK